MNVRHHHAHEMELKELCWNQKKTRGVYYRWKDTVKEKTKKKYSFLVEVNKMNERGKLKIKHTNAREKNECARATLSS